jgi:hypothetical protein
VVSAAADLEQLNYDGQGSEHGVNGIPVASQQSHHVESAALLETLRAVNPSDHTHVAPMHRRCSAQQDAKPHQTVRASALQISSVAPKSLEPSQQKEISRKK